MSWRKPTRKFLQLLLLSLYNLYSRWEHRFVYKRMEFKVLPGVCHPRRFYSCKFLLSQVEKLQLTSKAVLELGSGCGTIACLAAAKGAISFASDISSTACRNTAVNAEANHLEVGIMQSDVFAQMPEVKYDIIAVNPPFIAKYPEREKDFAFYAGEQLEFYQEFFQGLAARLRPAGKALMVLSRTVERAKVEQIINTNHLQKRVVEKKRRWLNTFEIWQISVPSSL